MLTKQWMYNHPRSENIDMTLFHPAIYHIPLDTLVMAFV